ncbi:MAG: hypothetical protein K1X78_02390 [Verrucomicrobiaceae bacterium]|nr:hypothetical protein [Verrucomicrobiaceae bacterium]
MKKSLISTAVLVAAISFAGLDRLDAAPAKSGKAAKSAAKTAAKPSAAVPTVPKEIVLTADIDIQPPELGPESSIEVRFPSAMVQKETVGTVAQQSPLEVQPELAGEFKWTSTRSGLYRLTQPPHFNTAYRFKLKAGLKDLDGKSLSTALLDEVTSAPFRVIDQYPKWFNTSDTSRTATFLFEFNDGVNPSEAAKSMFFVCGETKSRVAAKARHATGKDFDRYSADAQATWAEQVTGAKPSVSPDGARLSALIVEPESPLAVGKGWKLNVASGMKNMSGHDSLAAGESIEVGDVQPFEVRDIGAHTPFDRDYYVRVLFNKTIYRNDNGDDDPKVLAAVAKKIAAAVKIEPAVEITSTDADWRSVAIHGKFTLNTKYTITVGQEIESSDGLQLAAVAVAEKTFETNPAYVATPAFVNAQLATGKGEFECAAANVRQVRVRAKRLTGPQLMEAIEKYQPYERAFHSEPQKKAAFKVEPFESYPGQVVFDRSFPINKPLDRSDLIRLNWKEILGSAKAGPLFLEVEGTAAEGAGKQNVIAQSLVQFTDLGIVQKTNGRESMVFVVSLKTGKPVQGVRLTMVDGERKLLGSGDTDANGIAIVQGVEPKFVSAEKDGDCTAIRLQDGGSSIGLWSFNIPTAWESPWEGQRSTFIFADRPVYRPGETAHLKSYARRLSGDDLQLDAQPLKARMVLRDPRYRIVMDKQIAFSANGSWNDDLVLPEGPLGWYTLNISFPSAKGEDGNGRAEDGNGQFTFRIEDYRPNSFEVKVETDKIEFKPERIRVPLTANYYMGKALSQAKINWSAYRTEDFAPPENFSAYHFGDAPAWAGYGKERGTYFGEEEHASWDAFGDAVLNEDGTAMLEMPVPPPDKAAMPQNIRVEAEVTDINEQTINASSQFRVPGADFILGLKGPDTFGSTGKDVSLEVIAITPDGDPPNGDAKVDVKIERQSYSTIKIATAGGGSTTKDQVVLQDEFHQAVQLKAAAKGHAPSATITFKPAKAGTYFLTAESVDAHGKKLLSRLPFYVVGGGEFPWAMEDGSMMNLQPDKKELAPGQEATIVVKTPIAGTALVTVERNRFHKQYITQLSPDNPVIKVPVQDAESPNVFVSVIVVRGADGSPKQHKMPEYRVGYCELKVDSTARDLAIDVKPGREEVKPGEPVVVSAVVKDGKGAPVAGSDVTIFAVDEGVLSLMHFETPDPMKLFGATFPLAVKNWTSLDGILPEDAAERQRGNKGFLVGGGGDEEDAQIELRKNFVVTPLWVASVLSDAQGKVSATFTAPDNLTRYRIMAVAAAGVDRFGSAESAVKINKPLMVEPVVPRFARLGDEVLVKAVIHNTTPNAGDVEIELKLDDHASFVEEVRPYVPVILGAAKGADAKSQKRTLTLKAGATTATAFPIKFSKLGTTKWTWTARTTKWTEGAPALTDGTESVFEVNHPMPELREVRYARLDAKTPVENLLKEVSPQILEGEGAVEVSVSQSRLSEVRDALGYVLHYPYGCVEQTSSSMMPWLALGGYNDLFPEHLAKDKAKAAIQAGVNRILQMVTDDGGLAYWPGGQESSPWGTAYGGYVLLKARDAGASVPPEVVTALLDHLSKSLRTLDDEKDPYALTHAAMALYTLAKGGKAEPAYENLLFGKRDRIPEVAKLYLSLAMLIHDAPEAQVKELLGWHPKPVVEVKKAEPAAAAKTKATASTKGKSAGKTAGTKEKDKAGTKAVAKETPKPAPRPAQVPTWSYWWGNQLNKALRLIACTHMGLKEDADALATSILQSRNGRGEWGNTITNAWTLTSLAAYERSIKTGSEPLALAAKWDTQDVPLNLQTQNASAKTSFVLNSNLAAKPLSVSIPEGRTAFARIEAKAWPPMKQFDGQNAGYGITRSYAKLMPDGTVQDAKELRVGDMVIVTLEVEITAGSRYLAINDSLPAVFEAVNPEFETQGGENGGNRSDHASEPWFCDFREIRADRALFFTDYAPDKGRYNLTYLARVIAEGDTIAPPARIEAMYQPDKFGLSATQRVVTLPSGDGKKVAGK